MRLNLTTVSAAAAALTLATLGAAAPHGGPAGPPLDFETGPLRGATPARTSSVEMRYGQPVGTVERYIFSQRGWQEGSPMSNGNVFAGFLEATVAERTGETVLHSVELTDLTVTFLLTDDTHVKQPSDQMVGVPVRVVSTPGTAPEMAMAEAEIQALPVVAGISPSSLRMDLPTLLIPLPPGPIDVGDTWSVPEHIEITGPAPRGGDVTHVIEGSVTYTFAGMQEHPVAFQAQESVEALRILGAGRLDRTSAAEGFSSSSVEEISVEALFDPVAGRWIDVTYTVDATATMEFGGSRREMPMGYTNQFKRLRPRTDS